MSTSLDDHSPRSTSSGLKSAHNGTLDDASGVQLESSMSKHQDDYKPNGSLVNLSDSPVWNTPDDVKCPVTLNSELKSDGLRITVAAALVKSEPQDLKPDLSCSRSRSRSPSPWHNVKPKGLESPLDGRTSPTVTRIKRIGSQSRSSEQSQEAVYQPTLINHLPDAKPEAMCEFIELSTNTYQNKSLGLSKHQEDSMICDCHFDSKSHSREQACGVHSGCVNRELMIECLEGECKCRQFCLNQRLQRREYAPIDIVLTEKKGYGVRASASIASDELVYEYVGEVIGQATFVRRMKEYFEEGIRHFYFMALGRDEFIDATKKGGLGRFLNHSCRPNCKVEKWLVGRRVRMGVFTKRPILAGEELTFNYNVDRYGHDAQECFCGEFNCVGYIGGKQQTDISGMDDLYLDALGIADEVEQLGLKGGKKRKGKRLDEDFIPVMRPINIAEVTKVASAVRQAVSNRRILTKLLSRIRLTEDALVQRQLMRLHGFSLMANLLSEYDDDNEVLATALQILLSWPLITRNKLISTNIEPLVVGMATKENENVKCLAEQLIKSWVDLEVAYRIPKAIRDAVADDDEHGKRSRLPDEAREIFGKRARLEADAPDVENPDSNAPKFVKVAAANVLALLASAPRDIVLPPGWQATKTPDGATYFYHIETLQSLWEAPSHELAAAMAADWQAQHLTSVADIINRTKAEADAAAANLAAQQGALKVEDKGRGDRSRRDKSHRGRSSSSKTGAPSGSKSSSSSKSKDASKDKAMLRLFSGVVVRTMSMFKSYFEPDQFKRRAKEATQMLCDKERKSSHYASDKYLTLTPKREVHIREFVKMFVAKLLARKGVKVAPISSRKSGDSQTSSGNRDDSMPRSASEQTRQLTNSHHDHSHDGAASSSPSGESTPMLKPTSAEVTSTEDLAIIAELAGDDESDNDSSRGELDADGEGDHDDNEPQGFSHVDPTPLLDHLALPLPPPPPPPPLLVDSNV